MNCWIGLREPNDLADKWIGKPGYLPKGVACQAKTSDNAGFGFSGLVVNPLLCPKAFKQSTLQEAREKWNGFAANNQLPAGVTCENEGREKAVLKIVWLCNPCRLRPDGAVRNTGEDGEIGFTSDAD